MFFQVLPPDPNNPNRNWYPTFTQTTYMRKTNMSTIKNNLIKAALKGGVSTQRSSDEIIRAVPGLDDLPPVTTYDGSKASMIALNSPFATPFLRKHNKAHFINHRKPNRYSLSVIRKRYRNRPPVIGYGDTCNATMRRCSFMKASHRELTAIL
jgi:hypothetical protein